MILLINRIIHKLLLKKLKKKLLFCGENVYIEKNFSIQGGHNIMLGNNVYIGVNSVLIAVGAPIRIKGHFMSGPGLTIVSGNHRIDIKDKYMDEVSSDEKLPENDQEIIIEEDVWCGANVTILKGVAIGKGSVIAAGSVVTKNIGEYEIWGGVPAQKIRNRF